MGYEKQTILNEDNIIIDLINRLSSTPYKVNLEILDFIYKYTNELN